ncbi:adaptin ear-binding coat-associated protein 1 NECAP-1 protein [Tanacetum coccineum]
MYTNTLLFLPEVKAYKLRPPYLVKGIRYKSACWSESDMIWSGSLGIVRGNLCREVRLEEPDSGKMFAHVFIPSYADDFSVLDSKEHFAMEFSDGALPALLCREEDDVERTDVADDIADAESEGVADDIADVESEGISGISCVEV